LVRLAAVYAVFVVLAFLLLAASLELFALLAAVAHDSSSI
jgi:hypothetical protein